MRLGFQASYSQTSCDFIKAIFFDAKRGKKGDGLSSSPVGSLGLSSFLDSQSHEFSSHRVQNEVD